MKKIGFYALLLLFLGAIWYVFIKQYDYQINFETKTAPGTVYHKILDWDSWDFDTKKSNVEILDKNPFQEITQKIVWGKTDLILHWKLDSSNDSITKVTLGIRGKDQKTRIKNRLALLTGATDFTKSMKQKAIAFRSDLNGFLDLFKIDIEGKSMLPKQEYVYISNKGLRSDKANMMIRGNAYLYPKLLDAMPQKMGNPFVKVTDWDINNDSITFDFGFPVSKIDTLPEGIKYNQSQSREALKANFYGNYSLSDAAWFALLNYANQHDIEVENNPTEIFYDDPMDGGNDTKWKAEIYLPIQQ